MSVLRQPQLIGLERRPVNETMVMVTNDDRPFGAWQVPHAFAYSSGLIDITLTTSFAIDVSARIDRISEYFMDLSITRSNPAHFGQRARLQRKVQPLLTKPQPHPPCGTHPGETLEHRPNRPVDRFVRVQQHFAIGLTPDQSDG